MDREEIEELAKDLIPMKKCKSGNLDNWL